MGPHIVSMIALLTLDHWRDHATFLSNVTSDGTEKFMEQPRRLLVRVNLKRLKVRLLYNWLCKGSIYVDVSKVIESVRCRLLCNF